MPGPIRERRALMPLGRALRAGHFPDTADDLAAARRRLAFDDLFLLQLGLAIRRQREGRRPGISLSPPGALERRLRATLPYRLTGAQERVWHEIRADMAAPHPMNRLLQGDVGSGKTIVATLAILTAIEAGHQAALMAPTEILAEQHARTLRDLVGELGVELALLTNAVRGRARDALLEAAASGRVGCVIGTHAVVQETVASGASAWPWSTSSTALASSSGRRSARRERARRAGDDGDADPAHPRPHRCTATSTSPCSTSCRPGRRPVRTVARDERGRTRIYRFLREEIAAGRQVYVVYPLVAESEASDLRAATEMAERLGREVFPDLQVGLLHGRMSGVEKGRVMDGSGPAASHVLVSTTVIEVGIDVPNASVMLIEHAERFGLSQLHQLRGPSRPRAVAELVHPDEPRRRRADARRRIQAMTETDGRLPHRGGRPRAARARRLLRHAPGWPARVPHRRPAARRPAPRGRAPGRDRPGGPRSPARLPLAPRAAGRAAGALAGQDRPRVGGVRGGEPIGVPPLR